MTKTITFAAVHFSMAFSMVFVMSGSSSIGGAIAYYFHEKGAD